jgi:hypothetical protein
MAGTHSPKNLQTGDDSLIERDLHQGKRRTWSCPGDHTVAAYADGVLGKYRRSWIEFHLSRCERCRMVVADTLKARREFDPPFTPAHLLQKARALAVRRPVHRLRLWAPAGALAGIALLVAITTVARHNPEPTIARPAVAPDAPKVARSEPPPTRPEAVPDVVRNRQIPANVLTLFSPQSGGVISSDRLQFRWKSIPRARTYEVRIVKLDGDLVWQNETHESALQVPSEVALQEGAYFVWITASLDSGQLVKSAPVRFLVKRSQ